MARLDPKKALALVIREGTAEDGMVIQARGATDPGVERARQLRDALEVVAETVAGKTQIDLKLANALYGLSFHLAESVRGWKELRWDSEYSEILDLIETIFEGDGPE